MALVYVSITANDTFDRISFSFVSLILIVSLAALFYKESRLAQGHLIAEATVADRKTGRRGHSRIKYEFMALDGRQYQGESILDAAIGIGCTVSVAYRPEDPAVNQPVQRFLFYSLRPKVPR